MFWASLWAAFELTIMAAFFVVSQESVCNLTFFLNLKEENQIEETKLVRK